MIRPLCVIILMQHPIASLAADLPNCSDKVVETTLLNRHFVEPTNKILGSIVPYMLITPDDQNIALWKTNWQAKIENVRQDRLDPDTNICYCQADLAVEGGPVSIKNNPLSLLKMAPAMCENQSIEYRIQLTEDGGKVYTTSRCSGSLIVP